MEPKEKAPEETPKHDNRTIGELSILVASQRAAIAHLRDYNDELSTELVNATEQLQRLDFITNSLLDQLKLDALREIWDTLSVDDIEGLRRMRVA